MPEGADNAERKIILYDRFNGGISTSLKEGGAFNFLRSFDIHDDPAHLKVLPRTVKESGSTIVAKPIGAVRDRSGNTYIIDDTSKLYKRTSAASYSVLGTASGANFGGIEYWDLFDTVYATAAKSIYTYGRLAQSPSLTEKYATYIDQYNSVSGQTYTLTTGVNEGATHLWSFTPVHDGLKKITVNINTVGTGNWTLVIHDDGNNIIASKTIANGSLSTGDQDFTFDSQVRLQIGATYHVHVYSSVADGVVVTGTASNFSNADITCTNDFLISTKSGLHPVFQFTNFLCILNERYVSTYDGLLNVGTDANGQLASSFDLEALTFPSGYEGICHGVYDQYIVIGLEYYGSAPDQHSKGKLVFWDGRASSFNFSIDVFEGGVTTILPINNRLFFVAGQRGEVFEFLGGSYRRVRRLPNTSDDKYVRTGPQSATIHMGMPCFGFSFEHDNTTFEHGVYTYGHRDASLVEALSYAYPISTGNRTGTSVEIGFVQAFGTELFIGWKDDTSYGIDLVGPDNNPFTEAIAEGILFDNGAPWKTKYLNTIRVDHAALAANETVQISYKIDRETSWNDGTANSTVGSTETRYEVNKEFKDLLWKVTTTQTTTTPRIDSVLLDIEPRSDSELP